MQVQSTSVAAQVPAMAVAASSEPVYAAVSRAAAPAPAVKTSRVVTQLNRVNLRHLIDRQNGKFVSVDYRKIGGEKRTLTGRLGVKAFLKGGQNKVEAIDRPYLTMFDVKLAQYRTVSLDTVSEVRMGGKTYVVID